VQFMRLYKEKSRQFNMSFLQNQEGDTFFQNFVCKILIFLKQSKKYHVVHLSFYKMSLLAKVFLYKLQIPNLFFIPID
jgi:hypothetical protein